MDENRIRQLLLTNIDSGEKYASISISNNLICSSGNSDQDMSDIAIEFYKVLYGEDMEISNKMGSLFAGDTMNSYNTVIKGASDIIKKFWNDHYHCLANFWVLPTQVGRSCRKCNKAAGGDYMDIFLGKYLYDENFYGQFQENYYGYTRRFPRESFAELHMNLHPGKGKNLKEETEIREALTYMINLLEARMKAMKKTPYIVVAENYDQVPDLNMGYYSEFIFGEALMEDGTIIPLFSKAEYNEVCSKLETAHFCTGKYPNYSDVYVRKDYKEMFEAKRKKGKTFFAILHEMAKEVVGYED